MAGPKTRVTEMTLCLTYLASAAGSDWNIGRSIQLKHVKILENLAWESRYADLTEVQPTIGVPSLLTTWPPKGGREGGKKFTQLNSEQTIA